jgi:hypothetical protein
VWLSRLRTEDFSTATRQEVAVPLPPTGWHGKNRAKTGASETFKEDAEEGGRPGPAALKGRRDLWLSRQGHKRSSAHPESRMRPDAASDHDRPGPHFKGWCGVAVSRNGDDAAPHSLACKLADVTVDDQEAASKAVVTAWESAPDVVTRGAVHHDRAAGHLACQPVAGIARNLQPSTGHAFASMATHMASDTHRSRRHPGGHFVNPAEVSATLDRAVACIPLDAKNLPERFRSLVCSNGKSANGIDRQARDLVWHDAIEINRERAA